MPHADADPEVPLAMTERERFHCFLRGVHEAPAEVAKYPGLAVEGDLTIVYPFTSFFFANKDDTKLAKDLENGLKRAKSLAVPAGIVQVAKSMLRGADSAGKGPSLGSESPTAAEIE